MPEGNINEYIVVGSGCTGVQAAQTLIENGSAVLMLDVGIEDESGVRFPDKAFLEIRKTERDQDANFLGKKFEGIPWGPIKPGYHLTPGRKHVAKDTDKYIPYDSQDCQLYESLAKGGLGAAWGTGSYTFNREELDECGLDPEKMKEAYATVFSRIGITKGNASNDFEEEEPLQVDANIQTILKRYNRLKTWFNKRKLRIGQTPLAVITKDRGERLAYKYRDMDFWDDNDLSAYRPWITLNALKESSRFEYFNNSLVTRYKEYDNKIEVEVLNVKTNQTEKYYCRKLVLAASVFGTTRIVLRSNEAYQKKINYLCNSYYYIPCVNLKMLGKQNSTKRVGFSQLSLYMGELKDIFVASFFTYRSLLLFKLIKESPLNLGVSRQLFKFLETSFVIVGFHVPKKIIEGDYLVLEKCGDSFTKDKLRFFSEENSKEEALEQKSVKKLKKALRMLRCIPLKTIKTPKGASIHYAGTLPFSEENEQFTTSASGRLSNTNNVFIADASSFNFLPAKGITLTAMANAHRVALNSLKS